MEQEIERFNPSITTGLSTEEVNKRIQQNKVNYDSSVPTKSIKQIIFSNFFTLFNFLNLFLGIAIFAVGSYKNMLFLIIVVINTAISTFQEIHSKKVVDKLAIMAQSKIKVVRNGEIIEIPINDLVLDDVIVFNTGNQVPTDCIIMDGEVLSNESFITGEPDSITKQKDEMLLSGSYIVGGKCYARVEHIADENYTAQISSGAKYVKKINSEIMRSLNKIIKYLTFTIIPIGAMLFFSQFVIQHASIADSVVQSVAAMIGMIPEGLVLLTSTVLAVSVIRLSRSKVLVQELYCIETLARVDTLCLDKTGTLTEGRMEVSGLVGIKDGALVETDLENASDDKSDLDIKNLKVSKTDLENILANIAKSTDDENPTMQAIKAKYLDLLKEDFVINKKVPFSSKTKWSGISFDNKGSYVLGAPEFVLGENFVNYKDKIAKYVENYRVLCLAHSNMDFKDTSSADSNNRKKANENKICNNLDLPENLSPIGFILITDVIRKEASKTLEYFKAQGVDIKIISGDNPVTVSKIAKRVGVENADKYIDMSTLKTEDEVKDAACKYSIFGRVSPTQKKDLVTALQANGKTVAMTGDGVNDVLALKTADCSIAMANGSDATKNVSQLILLDSNFASMPKVVSEGRRTINNIERSASLFLLKNIYSSVLAVLFLFMSSEYPFEPVHISLISLVAIGIPSFLFALEPNNDRIHGNFLKNIISKALPTAITVIVSIFVIAILNKCGIISNEIYPTISVIAAGAAGLLHIIDISRARKNETRLPFSIYRLTISIAMVALFIFGLTYMSWWYNIVPLMPIITTIGWTLLGVFGIFMLMHFLSRKVFKIK